MRGTLAFNGLIYEYFHPQYHFHHDHYQKEPRLVATRTEMFSYIWTTCFTPSVQICFSCILCTTIFTSQKIMFLVQQLIIKCFLPATFEQKNDSISDLGQVLHLAFQFRDRKILDLRTPIRQQARRTSTFTRVIDNSNNLSKFKRSSRGINPRGSLQTAQTCNQVNIVKS